MSMLRCLYGRQFVKCALGDPSTSSIYLKVSDSKSTCQFIINLNARSLHGMTFTEKNITKSRPTSPAKADKSDGSLIRNGIFVDRLNQRQTPTALSEGYYRNEWGQSQNNDEKTDRKRSSKCEFAIDVRLLETFGIIGTAVAVGINVNNRFNEWMPSQHRRGIHDICQYQQQYQHKPKSNPLVSSQTISSPTVAPTPSLSPSISRGLECLSQSSSCVENDPCLATLRYCGACTLCRSLFDKLFRQYVFPSPSPSSTSLSPSILNVLSSKSAILPKLTCKPTEVCHEEVREENYIDDVDGPASVAQQPSLLCLDGPLPKASSRKPSPVPEATVAADVEKQPPTKDDDSSGSRLRKPSVFALFPEEVEKLQELPKSVGSFSFNSEDSHFSEDSIASSDESSRFSSECSVDEAPKEAVEAVAPREPVVPSSAPSTSFESNLGEIFRMASIEYDSQLNSIRALSLMNGDKPDEAMQCWSMVGHCENRSEVRSRAFYNMGVAYESGRHSINAQPDLGRAHDCYALAASMDHSDATYNLALFYLYGKGKVAVDLEKGLALLEIAANRGIETARNFLIELKRNQMVEEVRELMTRKPSSLTNLKNRPLRTSVIHSRGYQGSTSMFGPSMMLKPKHSMASRAGSTSSLATTPRRNSAPDLNVLTKSSSTISFPAK